MSFQLKLKFSFSFFWLIEKYNSRYSGTDFAVSLPGKLKVMNI